MVKHARGKKRRKASGSPDAQRSKRRLATGTFDPPAIDFASLFRGPLDDGELALVLRFVPCCLDWTFANWTAPDTVKVEVAEAAETGQRGGRLAPRWLHDLHMGMLADRPEDVGDLFTRCGNLPDRLYLENSAVSPSTGHEFLAIESQCPQPTAESQLISCMCRHCKYHFLFHFQQDSGITCASNTELGKGIPGLCHLVLAESHVHTPTDGDIFNPVTSTGTWHCSASSTCSVRVSVSVSKPRMKMEHIKLIVDEDRIRKQQQQAITEDPERFRSSKDDLSRSTLPILNAYLRDCTSNAKDKPPRRIALRNKLFYVQFGESCSHIFQYLGLQRRTVDDETFWFLPELEHYDNEKTPINTQRAFMEDARSEIQALIEEQGASEVQPWSTARFRLLQALNCPPSHDWNNFRFDANDVHLRALGTLPGPGDEVLKYAYQSQVDADPGNLRYYFEALKAKASTEDLLLFVGCQESLLDSHPQAFEPTFNPRPSSNDPLAQAYAHFNLGQDCSDDDFIIRKYHVFAQQSPAQKAQHRNQLFKIGSLRQSKKIMTAAADDFSLEEACDYLQLDREIKQGSEPSVELLETYVSLAVESGAPRYMCAAALFTLSEHFQSAALRSYAASVRREAYREAAALFDDLPEDENITVAADTAEPVDPNLPPGLGNLRNTCYLNSILQYCYTVTPIRELVLNFDPNAPGPSLDLANKNPEVYIGREFVLELQKLFESLRSASTKYVKPQQRLANAAWLSAHPDASEKTTSQTPAPPLPARPPPVPSAQAATAGATVTVAPIDLPTDDSPPASLDSSQTLINNPLESSYDDLMESDDQPAVVNPEMETAAEAHPEAEKQVKDLMRRLDQTEVVGTDQMDVEEVMGRIFNYFRTACNPLSIIHPNNPDYLHDIITDTFFITFATMRKQMASDEYSRSESHERWVTASPALDGPIHLHDALTSFFDREIIGDNMLSYTVIARPPRIFHICIQRSTVGGGKNTNAIEIPDVLYLDRYMEAAENTPEYRARHRRWDIKSELERLATIKTGKEKDKESTGAGDSAPKAASTPPGDDSVNRLIGGYHFTEIEDEQLSSAEDYVIIGDSELPVLETSPLSQHDPSIVGNSTTPKKRKASPDIDVDISSYEDNNLDAREETLRAELASLFDGMEREKYVLHAIICHMGQRATSGHYWVWIYDFAARVWRKYNDTTVTERAESETATVLAELSAAGEPYYIAYVRDEDKENLVSVPPRVIEVGAEPEGEKMDVDGAM